MTDWLEQAKREIAEEHIGRPLGDLYNALIAERARNLELRERHVRACVDMAERYDADIEGCSGEELTAFGEGIKCSLRLAYLVKYETFPPEGDAWQTEFIEMLKSIRKAEQ